MQRLCVRIRMLSRAFAAGANLINQLLPALNLATHDGWDPRQQMSESCFTSSNL